MAPIVCPDLDVHLTVTASSYWCSLSSVHRTAPELLCSVIDEAIWANYWFHWGDSNDLTDDFKLRWQVLTGFFSCFFPSGFCLVGVSSGVCTDRWHEIQHTGKRSAQPYRHGNGCLSPSCTPQPVGGLHRSGLFWIKLWYIFTALAERAFGTTYRAKVVSRRLCLSLEGKSSDGSTVVLSFE